MKQTVEPRLTKSQVKQRLKTATGLAFDILSFYDLSDEKLAKKFKRDLAVIKRFRKLTYLWTTGKSISKKPKYARKGKVGRPRIKRKDLTYKNYGKTCVHNALHKLMLHKDTPKVGKVPTLPFDLTFEKRILKDPRLSGISFLGFEYGYSASASEQSKQTHFRQRKFLRDNPKLAIRIPIVNHDINNYLMIEDTDSCASVLPDYCGTFSKNKDAVIHLLSKKVVKKGGLLWFTFCTRDLQITEGSVYKEIVKTIAKAGGRNYKYENIEGLERVENSGIFRYSSESGVGSPMYTFILRRIK